MQNGDWRVEALVDRIQVIESDGTTEWPSLNLSALIGPDDESFSKFRSNKTRRTVCSRFRSNQVLEDQLVAARTSPIPVSIAQKEIW